VSVSFKLTQVTDLTNYSLSAKRAIYTHLASSLQGLTTIRAFSAQELLQNEFDKHQNVHSAAFYMYCSETVHCERDDVVNYRIFNC
jgi:ATP-binding cassette subfamily C (CFTR/MRP) protein 4